MAHRGQQGVQGGAQGGLAVGHRLQVGERGTQRGGAKNSTAIYSAALNSTVINRTAEGGAAVWGESKDGVKGGGGGCQKGCSDIAENSTAGNSTEVLEQFVQRISVVCAVEEGTVRMAVKAVGLDFDAVLRWVSKEKAMVEQNRAVKRTKEKDAVRERLRKKSSKEGFGKGDRHYDGWCGHQWKRKDAGKWLRRRLPVRMRMGQAPWLRVEDTEYGCLCTGVLHDEVQPTVSRTVLR